MSDLVVDEQAPVVITHREFGEIPAADVVDDVSLHRVWWQRRWVLWYDEPRQFEAARPWTHKVPALMHALVALLPVIVGAITFPALSVLVAVLAVLVAAAASAAYVTAVARAEIRFHAWRGGNDGRLLLEGLLPPRTHQPMFYTSGTARRATKELAEARDAVEEYALAHASRLRGLRKYGTPGWVRLSALTGHADHLLRLVESATRFRDANETWGQAGEWEAEFDEAAAPKKRPLLWRPCRPEDNAADVYEAMSQDVIDTLRTLRHTAETQPGLVARQRLYTAAIAKASWLRGVGGKLLIALLSVAGLIGIIFGLAGIWAAVSPQSIPDGTYQSCTIESVYTKIGDKDLLRTSCGPVYTPDRFAHQVTVGTAYEIQVISEVGIPMLTTAHG